MSAYYFETRGIYRTCDHIRCEVKYIKGVGYAIDVSPCEVNETSCGYTFGCTFCAEYFNFYESIKVPVATCARRNARKELEANEILEKIGRAYALKYISTVKERGGKVIELTGKSFCA